MIHRNASARGLGRSLALGRGLALALCLVPAVGLVAAPAAPKTATGGETFDTKLPPADLADRLLSRMGDEEILAQTFMLGWVGADPSPLILEWIEKRHIGGVKIFGWNTEDSTRTARAVGELQRAARASRLSIPLLVATDQEGGWIRHVKGKTSETPGNMAIGASSIPEDAYRSGYYIGREIAALGINMNFAPGVDVFTNQQSVLIGPRAFSDDPVETAVLGAAFAKGQARAGVIATAKHFPGHGDTQLDSHGILPRIGADFDLLWKRELVPYRMLVKEGVPAIMSGHLAFPMTKAGYEPASLSRYFLTDILRNKMGYTGLIITDDLMMNGAIATTGSLAATARKALEAGNDILMLSKTPFLDDPIWTELLYAYRNDRAFRDRVRDAARRTLILKLTNLRGPDAPPYVPDLAGLDKKVPDPEGKAFFQDLAARSVTVIKDAPFPVEAAKAGRVLLAGQFDEFFKSGLAAFPKAEKCRFSYYPPEVSNPTEMAALLRAAAAADTVIFCLANRASQELLDALRPLHKRIIVLSTLSPVYLSGEDWVSGSIAVYSYSRESFIAGFSAMVGRLKPRGVLPFRLQARGQQ